MPTFIIPFTVPGNYTYDPDKIEIIGGLAKLKENLSNVYARWHLNQSSGSNVPDSSDNNRDGTTINDPSWIPGKLNNCISLNGTTQKIDCGAIAGFDSDNSFSIECWAKWTSSASMALVSKMLVSGTLRGWLFFVLDGHIYFMLRTSTSNYLLLHTIATFNDDIFHHIVVTYDASNLAAGVNIYVDGNNLPVTTDNDSLSTGTIINNANCEIGARNNTDYFEGSIDEVLIYDKELIQIEVDYKYSSGTGHEDEMHYTDKPAIFKTAGDTDSPILNFTNFVVSKGLYEGSLTYQLSDDGINWLYWNGSAWAGAGTFDYNSEVIVNANISTFTVIKEKIYVKSFLICNGIQHVEIDEIQIGYTTNLAPYVDAGTNKTAKDEETITPFSDCSFSDPDGTIEHVYYKVDNEVGNWAEIVQGGYGTLLEAVQAFTYKFSNIGIITVRLQAEDNDGSKNEDSLTVTVSKYTITFNIKDAITGNHLTNITFIAGDGSDNKMVNSPFSWDYEVGTFYIEFKKAAYAGVSDYITIIGDDSYNYLMGLTLTQPDIATIIDTFYNERIADHTEIGSFGKLMQLIDERVLRLLGLNGENLRLYNSVHTNGNLTQQDAKLYKTKEDLDADINEIATYQSQSTYIDNKFNEGTFKKL